MEITYTTMKRTSAGKYVYINIAYVVLLAPIYIYIYI